MTAGLIGYRGPGAADSGVTGVLSLLLRVLDGHPAVKEKGVERFIEAIAPSAIYDGGKVEGRSRLPLR
jgi:hypothetical protein